RHTRFSRDWSSDVCSSDLTRLLQLTARQDLLADWLPALVAGEKRLVLAHEEAFESDVWARRATRATRDGSDYLLEGSKSLVAGAERKSGVIVSATLEDGSCGLFLVEP